MTETHPIAVITGSANGLGRSVAQRFLAGGYQVIGLDLKPGVSFEGLIEIPTDITDAEAVASAFSSIRAIGSPDVLVNAAGVYPRSTLADASVSVYRLVFDVNVLGTVLVTQAFAASRDSDTPGSVINIASVDGMRPFSKSILYSASKAAIINFTAAIADELAEQGIRVNGIAPTYIATDRVIDLVGEIPAHASTPSQVAELCWDLSRPSALPLVAGQTLVTQKSALDLHL